MNLSNFAFACVIGSLLLVSCKKRGCTDPSATNFNTEAEKDDESCLYTINDIDGNVYDAKTYGSQVWIVKNLETKKYRNGDVIPQVQDQTMWNNLTTGAWCYYNNDPTKGMLYNWYAVNDPRGLAPTGFHIPSDIEWEQLINHFGGTNEAGYKMKSAEGWDGGVGGSNESGFNGLPGGYRLYEGYYYFYGGICYWWSLTESSSLFANCYNLHSGSDVVKSSGHKGKGYSVRCLRD